jgi:hypothetical protein
LTTASSSTVTLVNGAQECNVFWQVGSSATLGTDSVFRGNILAQDSVTVTTGVTVHGRAMAREAAVTLDTDTFVDPSCATTPVTTTTAATASTASTASTAPTAGDSAGDDALGFDSATPGSGQGTSELADTGVPIGALVMAGGLLVVVGIAGIWLARTSP